MNTNHPGFRRFRARRRVHGRWQSAVWLAAGALVGAPGAWPADSAQGSAAVSDANALHEVIVYARRRPEPITDTPVAVTAFTGEELREASAVLLDDVGRDVPNVHMYASPQSVSALDVSMRGQTVNRSAIVFDPAVGLYVDGVYVANGQGAMMTLLDMDSVEVLRGSQGTLFGRNNTGGSILLLTHRPDLDQPAAEFASSAGDYAEFMTRAIANVPVSGTFGLRFAFQSNERNGYGSSDSSGQNDLGNQHRYQARLGALWKPDAATDVYFTYERFQASEAGAILHPLAGPPPGTLVAQLGQALAPFAMIPGIPTVSFPSDPYQTDGNFPASDRAATDSLQLTATHVLDGGPTVKLILGYRHLDAATALDVDASTLPLADSTLINTSNQKSAELQLNDKVLGGRLDWIAGLYWFRDDGSAPSVQAPASQQFLAALGQVAQLTGCSTSPPSPTCLDLTSFFSPLPVYEQNSVMNRSIAAYLHGEYQLMPDWFVAAGLRRTEDRRDLEENDYVIIPGPVPTENCTITGAPPGPCPLISESVGYGFWSWELSTRYRITPELNAYARAGRSQRSGGWNAPVSSLQDQPFRPEQLTDFELGLKADLLGGALLVNADVFYGKYDDMQRLLAELVNGTPATLVTNAGRARISGAELEARWRLTRQLSLLESFGYTDARYQSFLYQPLLNQPGIPGGGPVVDLSGNDFYQTPRYQASLAAICAIPTAAGDVTVRADYAWQDKIQFNVINDFNFQPSYGTLNGRVALASHSRRWELALFGDNLTDKRYAYTGGTVEAFAAGAGGLPTPTPTIAWQIPGPPRTFGVEGTYRWNPSH